MAITMSTFEASAYQQAIFDAVAAYDHDIVVSACAGSGKSTTLKQLLDYIPAHMSVLYLAFNSDAAKSLGEKLTAYAQEKRSRREHVCNFTSSTIHSLGNSALRNAGISGKPMEQKYNQICKQYLSDHLGTFKYTLIPQFAKLVNMVRLTLSDTDEQSLLNLMDRFEIDIPTVYLPDLDDDDEDDCELVETPEWTVIKNGIDDILKQGIKLAKTAKECDFTDMIWLPSSQAINLQPKQYDWVLVDEAQDLSPAQRELVLKARRAGGRFIAVGDRKQAIYGFAGASLQSIDEIIAATGAVEMPLSICYRCPKSVIDLANTVWPGTEARNDAPDGVVQRITADKVESLVQAGDLILCRLTAPLVEKCLALLRSGIRATVRGKDLGSQFTTLLENIKKAAKIDDDLLIQNLVTVAQEYQSRQIEILSRNLAENEMKIDTLKDKIDTLKALYHAYLERSDSPSISGFQEYIKKFFADDPTAQIVLSTGHRAKGLEYKRVFILQSDRLPHPKAVTLEAITQEYNLMYVMYTRAMETLYLVCTYVPTIIVESEPTEQLNIVEIVPEREEEQTTDKPLIPLSALNANKGGRNSDGTGKSSGLVKMTYKLSPEVIGKLDALAKDNPSLNKSAFIDALLSQWFVDNGL